MIRIIPINIVGLMSEGLDMRFQETRTFEEKLKLMREMSEQFRTRAAKVDEEASFPFENIKELKASGYTQLTVPKNTVEKKSLYMN